MRAGAEQRGRLLITLQEKIDMVLDAYRQKVVNEYELRQLVPLVIREGDKLAKTRLIELMTRIPRDEWGNG